VNQDTIDLLERVRTRLVEKKYPFAIAGPQSEAMIAAAEEQLGVSFPPSYREFLREFGTLALPSTLGIVQEFVGLDDKAPASGARGVVERTLHGRAENRLRENLLVVGIGADVAEWYVIDVDRVSGEGEAPVLLFDARSSEVDQQFYDSFDQMVSEVLSFVEENLGA
jgi:hypothetical protein